MTPAPHTVEASSALILPSAESLQQEGISRVLEARMSTRDTPAHEDAKRSLVTPVWVGDQRDHSADRAATALGCRRHKHHCHHEEKACERGNHPDDVRSLRGHGVCKPMVAWWRAANHGGVSDSPSGRLGQDRAPG